MPSVSSPYSPMGAQESLLPGPVWGGKGWGDGWHFRLQKRPAQPPPPPPYQCWSVFALVSGCSTLWWTFFSILCTVCENLFCTSFYFWTSFPRNPPFQLKSPLLLHTLKQFIVQNAACAPLEGCFAGFIILVTICIWHSKLGACCKFHHH